MAPLLKTYGFGATFYVTQFGKPQLDPTMYLSWEQIRQLETQDFEVGNHSYGHGYFGAQSLDECTRQLRGIEELCAKNQVTKPTTFCWPVYSVNKKFFPYLTRAGYVFARGGHEHPYTPGIDSPLDVPSFTIHDNSLKNKDSFAKAAQQATQGRIVVFTFHGVPDLEHPSVGVEPARFEELLQYLKENHFTVIALRDMAKYVDARKAAQFLPFPDRLPWGGVTAVGNTLYLSVSKLPRDRQVTLPNVTTPIARAYFIEDSQKRSLTVLKADTGIQTILVPNSPFATRDSYPTVIVAQLHGVPRATILEFGFPGAPAALLVGNEIRASVPLAADLTQLAPLYRTGSPQVTGKPASGAVQDFSKPQSYTITAPDRSTRTYHVVVTPTRGAVALSNPSFEVLEDATAESPQASGWIFWKRETNGELGVKDILESPSAPPSPDGTRQVVYLRGAGNSIAQSLVFDAGNYTIAFDAVKRQGYEKTAAALSVTLDGVAVFTLKPMQITEAWSRYRSAEFTVTSGKHTLAFVLGEGGGMDIIDNVVLSYVPKVYNVYHENAFSALYTPHDTCTPSPCGG